MADRGSIAYDACQLAQENSYRLLATRIRCIGCDGSEMVMGSQSTSDGDPAQPSLSLNTKGVKRFRWVVPSGTHSLQINVKQACNLTPRPAVIIKANPSIGVNADVSGTASAGTGWTVIGPLSVSPTSAGRLWVELWNYVDGQPGVLPCLWDHLIRT